MLVVETIGKIRRAYFVQGKPIKAICRELKVSRKVVRKVLRSGATSFEYEREVQPLPKVGPWKGDLERLLAANAARPGRERLTLVRVFEELRGLGYQGGYDAVRRYARGWHREHAATSAAAFVPLSFTPGEAYQFDWSHEVVLIDGTTVTVKVAHVRLCHSRMPFVRAYPRETQEMVFDAHDRAFAFFRGACTRGIYDNMKTAVEAVFVGKDRPYNRPLLQMCSHHLVQPVACTPPSPAGGRPPPGRAGRLHAGLGLGEGAGREPGRAGARALLHAAPAGEELRRAERLADGPGDRLRQGAPASRAQGPDRLGGVRGVAREPRAVRRAVRRLPRRAGVGVEDLPRAFRQQPLLGNGERGRAPGGGPGLRGAGRDPPGRARRRRASPLVRAGPDGQRPVALRPRPRPQARSAAQRGAVQGLGAARRARARAPQARRHRR